QGSGHEKRVLPHGALLEAGFHFPGSARSPSGQSALQQARVSRSQRGTRRPAAPFSEPRYCTLAVTDALPWMVNVHVFTLLPPLEHAPDQIASRVFVTLSVIDVPVLNVAEPVLPTATLIPAGLELTRSPLRPVAVTESVAVWAGGAGGFTVSVAVWLTPPKLPPIVTDVAAVTPVVVMLKLALVAPAATVTLAGTP